MQGELYLHGLSVLDQNGPQLSIELEEDLPLSRPVQVSYGQGFDVQRLAPLQLHLQENVEAQGWAPPSLSTRGGRGSTQQERCHKDTCVPKQIKIN